MLMPITIMTIRGMAIRRAGLHMYDQRDSGYIKMGMMMTRRMVAV